MYLDDYDQFVSTARFWTETYAKERSTDEAAVARLTDMGFPAVRSGCCPLFSLSLSLLHLLVSLRTCAVS